MHEGQGGELVARKEGGGGRTDGILATLSLDECWHSLSLGDRQGSELK